VTGRVLAWVVWWGLLFGLWLAFVGVWNDPYERIAGYCAAALGATTADVVRAQGLLRIRVEPRWAALLLRPLVRVPFEFALVLTALARRRGGSFRVVTAPVQGAGRERRGRRVVVGAGGSIAPNTLVLAVDEESGEVLLHELVPSSHPELPV